MRKEMLIGFVATHLLACAAGHAEIGISSAEMTEQQRVIATEDAYVAAEVSRDEATLRRIVDDRFVFNRDDGTTIGKEEFIQSVLGMSMVGQTVRERTVLVEGDIALIFGTADLRFAASGGDEVLSSLRYTSTYVKRHGQWRMLALQMQRRSEK